MKKKEEIITKEVTEHFFEILEQMDDFIESKEKLMDLLSSAIDKFDAVSDKILTILEMMKKRIDYIVEVNNLLDMPKGDN